MNPASYGVFTLAVDGKDTCKIDTARSSLGPNEKTLCVTTLFNDENRAALIEETQRGKRFVELTLRQYDILGRMLHQRTYLDCYVQENQVRDGARWFVFSHGREKQ